MDPMLEEFIFEWSAFMITIMIGSGIVVIWSMLIDDIHESLSIDVKKWVVYETQFDVDVDVALAIVNG